MLAGRVVCLDFSDDASFLGFGTRPEMALQGGPAIAREVAGVGLRDFEMELEAVGGAAQAEGLVAAHGRRGQMCGPVGQIERIAVPVEHGQPRNMLQR